MMYVLNNTLQKCHAEAMDNARRDQAVGSDHGRNKDSTSSKGITSSSGITNDGKSIHPPPPGHHIFTKKRRETGNDNGIVLAVPNTRIRGNPIQPIMHQNQLRLATINTTVVGTTTLRHSPSLDQLTPPRKLNYGHGK